MSETAAKSGDTSEERDRFSKALAIFEAQLNAENRFIEQVKIEIMRTELKATGQATLDQAKYPNLLAKTGHDNLMHVAQFFFLLEALNCTGEAEVSAFIASHNEKLQASIERGTYRETEFKRAIFKPNRLTVVKETVKHFKRPVFAVNELGHLLIDLMSPRHTENLVKELLIGGIMRQRGVGLDMPPPTTDPRRILVEPTEKFRELYIQSLLQSQSVT